ncbi:MAG: LPXTG cell wall anchor domain-containing protein [Oscillospiraceae bacterium]|nr:LPXTG cell wall anchor domain-containing protein [Oscillospiraceae bacterium]
MYTNDSNVSTQLPQTGGIGTTLFTALGGLMTAMAGAILTLRRKRKTA